MNDKDLQPEDEKAPKETDQAPLGRKTNNVQGSNPMKGHVPPAGAPAQFRGRHRRFR